VSHNYFVSSGKVAMVSGWKTSLKESLECEAGVEKARVLTEKELASDPPFEPDDVDAPPKKRMVRKKTKTSSPTKTKISSNPVIPKPAIYTDPEQAMKSTDFLCSVLRRDNIKFLHSVDIRTAEQLIEADKTIDSPLIKELVKHRTELTGTQAQMPTCVRLMYDWTQRVKGKIEEIEGGAEKTALLIGKKRGPKPKNLNDDVVPKPSGGTIHDLNALQTLSAAAQTFLKSIGITTTEQILSRKSSSISNAYIDWRAENNIPPLKGYGSIATVSGWKTQVRKFLSEHGVDISSIEVPRVESPPVPEPTETPLSVQERVEYSTHPNLLLGLSSHSFDVANSRGA
jgi:hypothetical protein